LVDFLEQGGYFAFVGPYAVEEVAFESQEGGDVGVEKFGVVEELLCAADLFGFALLLWALAAGLHSGLDDVPVLEDGNPVVFWFEEFGHVY
jgi:hypothetical protein